MSRLFRFLGSYRIIFGSLYRTSNNRVGCDSVQDTSALHTISTIIINRDLHTWYHFVLGSRTPSAESVCSQPARRVVHRAVLPYTARECGCSRSGDRVCGGSAKRSGWLLDLVGGCAWYHTQRYQIETQRFRN